MSTYALNSPLAPTLGFNLSLRGKVAFLVVHLIAGYIFTLSSLVCGLWIYVFCIYSFQRIISKNNRDGWAHMAAGYIVGLELVFRMINPSGIPYEFGKYAVVAFLFLGMMVNQRKSFPTIMMIYLVCLLPSLLVVSFPNFEIARKFISFNLSGPLTLAVSTIYFYNRRLSNNDIGQIIYFMAAALVAAVVIIIARMPNLSEMGEISQSSEELSGGFGPNQVSTLLGFGFFAIFVCWILEISVTGSQVLDLAVSAFFFTFAVLTFSRGGIITSVAVASVVVIIQLTNGKDFRKAVRVLRLLFILLIVAVVAFIVLDNLTNGSLTKRYLESLYGDNYEIHNEDLNLKFDASGREDILERDISLFTSYPIIGVGPGMAAFSGGETGNTYADSAAAHTEFTRLLAEHGLLGLLALLILLFNPLLRYRSVNSTTKVLMAGFILISVATMTHSAMRVAMPGFVYGLSFIFTFALTSSHPLQRKEEA